jgi:uncharacterized protein YhaN
VVRERAHAAREALEAARRREADTALEYHAWSLLLEALREAETAEGRHLGETLGREIAERFGRLTRGRYGGLALGPDLQTEGLHTSSGVQPTDSLSEGLKEQLATILRVSVAEQLRGSLVLDDHLTQTDLARIGWFRELLRAASAQIQIVVLTCRPDDYLDSAEQPASPASFHHTGDRLHAIDLARVIRRFA